MQNSLQALDNEALAGLTGGEREELLAGETEQAKAKDNSDTARVKVRRSAIVQPPQPKPEMFTGLLGEVVRVFTPFTEASPASIALQFLVAVGNAVGRGPHFYVGETRHGLNSYLAVVGRSSRARKGDGGNIAMRVMEPAAPDWCANIASGFSSGEGLINALRDPLRGLDKNGKEVLVDEGVADKRLLVVETEFSQPLKMFRREGNTLSNVLRDAWDGKTVLRTMTRKSPLRATQTHLSIIAHTTPEDLRAYLSDLEIANGLGNRFMFALVDRTKLLANPGRAPTGAITALADKVCDVLSFAQNSYEMHRTEMAAALWEQIYPRLTADKPGLLGKLLARAEAHVARLSALYALIAQSREVDVQHIQAAVAAWDNCVASTQLIFRDRTGNHAADRIKAEMLPGDTLALTEIREQLFKNHVTAGCLRDALDLLEELGEVRLEIVQTAGRSATLATRLDPTEKPDATPEITDLEETNCRHGAAQ